MPWVPVSKSLTRAGKQKFQSIEAGAADEVKYLQLAETLSSFREKLLARAKTLDVRERQQILRLLVKEILVDTQSITIRHSIPISQTQKSPATSGSPTPQTLPSAAPQPPSYLLRPRSPIPATQQSGAGRTGPGVRGARSPLCPLRRRLQHLRGQRASRTAGDEERNAIH